MPTPLLLAEPARTPPRSPAPPTRTRGRARVVLAVLVAFLLVGNLSILGASLWARRTTPLTTDVPVAGVGNFEIVDDGVWRGAAPSRAGYRQLAEAGVRTIVDLRAETDIEVDDDLLTGLGLTRVAIPIRDGQTPTSAEVERFLAAVDAGPGITFVHCGAGVGRTGTMVASYVVATGQADGWTAMRRNLAVGPPSLEQLAFAAGLDGDSPTSRPDPVVVAVSRLLDAPRRIWVGIRS